MEGDVSNFIGVTLTVLVDLTSGVGTFSSWNVSIAGEPGATGATGTTGATGSAGPTGSTGPAGVRGSLYQGVYANLAALPTIDGVTVMVGDTAMTSDTSTMYRAT